MASPSPSEWAYDADYKSEVPCAAAAHPFLVGDDATMTDKESQFSALAKEAKEFYQQLTAKVSYT